MVQLPSYNNRKPKMKPQALTICQDFWSFDLSMRRNRRGVSFFRVQEFAFYI